MTAREEKPGFHREALPHLDAVYRFALRLTGSPDEARDLVQETFLRAYRSWDQYTTGTRARSWLFTICRNVFLRQRDRGRRLDEIVRTETGGGSDASGNPASPVWVASMGRDPEGEFFDALVDDEVLRAVDALPEEYRTAVVLSDLDGLPYDEISQLMGVPVGTVKSRIFRGRRLLRKALYDYAVEMGHIPASAAGDPEGGDA